MSADPNKKSWWQKAAETQVWKSIFRTGIPKNRRQRMMVVLNGVFLHLHPVRLPKHAVKVKYTWCMGGINFLYISCPNCDRHITHVLLQTNGRVCLWRYY